MRYRIILSECQAEDLKKHILADRSKEQMAVLLCGTSRLHDEVRLLGNQLFLLPPEAFSRQSSSYLELSSEIQKEILRTAASQGLSQVDFHSHPGDGHYIGFSGTDDHHEKVLARYLSEKIPGTHYASVVMNRDVFDARVWEVGSWTARPRAVASIRWGGLDDREPYSSKQEVASEESLDEDERFCRQVLAFGRGLQERLNRYRIGVVGVGGIGGIIVEQLARLGGSDWVLIDDDVVEMSNLNRLPGSTQRDVYHGVQKVDVAHRNISSVNPYAKVRKVNSSVADHSALDALKACDLIVCSTDNHSSRLIVNRLSVQYLIPLVHIGVAIEVDEDSHISDMSGEYIIPSIGQWCLQCAGIIDSQMAGWELADKDMRSILRARGYIRDTPAPAVYHLNSTIASLAVSEIHNLIYAYKAPRRYLVYDTLRGELVSLDVQLKEDCPLCSIESGISGIGDVEALPDYNAKPRAIPYAHECEILGSVASEFDGLSDDDVASHDHAWDVGYHSFRGH